jgi:type IV fimbrial biogenesis protein FimT
MKKCHKKWLEQVNKIMRNQKGVTLIELMVALTVASILLGAAIPSFRQTIINSRLSTIANEFISSINYIRSEAIKAGRSVTLCKSTDGSSCSTSNTVYWDSGWIAWVDLDADGAVDTNEILRTWPALASPYTLRSSAFPNAIRYNSQGVTTADGNFAVCHDSTESGAKAVLITRVRPRMGIDSDSDQLPELISGSDLSSCESP